MTENTNLEITLIPLHRIRIGDRQRKEFNEDALFNLKKSIAARGLLHPIAVRNFTKALDGITDESSNNLVKLIAGHRRLKALAELSKSDFEITFNNRPIPPHHVPVVFINSSQDLLAYKEIELEENLIREDLTWQERTAAINELHELRTAQNPKQTVADTTREINKTPQNEPAQSHHHKEVSRALLVAQHMDDPEVAAAKTEKDAFKVVTRKLEKEFLSLLPEPESPHEFRSGDMKKILPTIKDGSIKCIVADPPYGVGADQFNHKGQHMYEDTPDYAFEIYTEIIEQAARLLTSDGVMYLFCDWAWVENIQDIANANHFNYVSRPLIWTKGSASQDGSAKVTGWRHTYECIVVLQRSDFRPKGIVNDVISHCLPEIQTRSHAAGKPEALYKFLMSQVCDTGDVVLDPCCGGGTVFPAATSLQLRAIGIELNPEFADHCKEMMMKGIGDVAELEDDEDEDVSDVSDGEPTEQRVATLGDF